MKRILAVLLLFSFSFAEVIYTDGTKDIETCVVKDKTANIDLPCPVKDLYFSPEIEASITQQTPNTITFVLREKEGSITAVCDKFSYTFLLKAKDKCDNHKVIKDKRIQIGKKLKETDFDKEELLNRARGLLRGMVKSEPVRGYNIKPFKFETVINNDDYFKANFFAVYEGGRLVGLIGKIKNYSQYITKKINVRDLMRKGFVLVYIEGMEDEVVSFEPEEERYVFIVALKDSFKKIPYLLGD